MKPDSGRIRVVNGHAHRMQKNSTAARKRRLRKLIDEIENAFKMGEISSIIRDVRLKNAPAFIDGSIADINDTFVEEKLEEPDSSAKRGGNKYQVFAREKSTFVSKPLPKVNLDVDKYIKQKKDKRKARNRVDSILAGSGHKGVIDAGLFTRQEAIAEVRNVISKSDRFKPKIIDEDTILDNPIVRTPRPQLSLKSIKVDSQKRIEGKTSVSKKKIKASKYEAWKPDVDDILDIKENYVDNRLVMPLSSMDISDDPIGSVTEKIYAESNEFFQHDVLSSIVLRIRELGLTSDISKNFPFGINVVTYIVQIAISNDSVSKLLATGQFITICANKFAHRMLDVVEHLQSLGEEFIEYISVRWPLRTESLDTMEAAMNNLAMLLTSDLILKFKTFILQIVSYHAFEKDFSHKIKTLFGDEKPMSLIDFIPHVCKSIITLLRAGEAWMNGLPFHEAFLSGDPVVGIIRNTQSILAYRDATYPGLPVPGFMCEKEFVSKLEENINVMSSMLKSPGIKPSSANALHECYTKALLAKNEKMTSIMSKKRLTPYAFVLWGAPGVGKGVILPKIFEIHSEVKGRKFEQSHVFHRQMFSQYIEGYSPYSHPYGHWSEPGSKSKEIAARTGDDVVMELTSLIDSLPYAVNSAFEGKGKIFALFECIGADCNSPNMNLDIIVNNRTAFYRRFDYIHVRPMPEFTQPGTAKLDVKKAIQAGGDPMDRYLFTISVREPVTNEKFVETAILTDARWPVFREFLSERIKDRIATLERVEAVCNPVAESNEVSSNPIRASYDFYKHLYSLYYHARYIVNFSGHSLLYALLSFVIIASYLVSMVTTGIVSRSFSTVATYCKFKSDHHAAKVRDYKEGIIFPSNRWIYITSFATLVAVLLGSYIKTRGNNIRERLVRAAGWCLMKDNPRASALPLTEEQAMELVEEALIKQSESKTDFKLPSEANDPLNHIEEEIGATDIKRKIHIRDNPTYWNDMYLPPPNPKSLNHYRDILSVINSNVRKVKFYSIRKNPVETYVTGVYGNYALINAHCLSGIDECVMELVISPEIGRAFFFERKYSARIGEDIILFKIKHTNFVDIRDYMVDHIPTLSCNGYVGMQPARVKYCDTPIQYEDVPTGTTLTVPSHFEYNYPGHKPGLCGTPIIAQTSKGYHFVGIHAAGARDSPLAYGVPIFLNTLIKIDNGMFEQASEGKALFQSLELPVMKSPFRFERFEAIKYFGKLPGPVMINSRSELRPTRYSKLIPDLIGVKMHDDNGKPLYSAPPMKPFVKDGEYYSPFNNALRKMNRGQIPLKQDVLRRIVKELTDRFAPALKGIRPTTVEVAINGLRDDSSSRRINVRTAGGVGFNGKKDKYLPIVEETEEYLTREPISEVKRRVQEKLERMAKEETTFTCYKASPKDEARETAKCETGQTRLFYGAPLDSLIILRMFLMPLYNAMLHSHLFCSAVGINMHLDANELYEKLNNFSDYSIEGDYKSYEFNVPFEIAEAACTIIYDSYKRAGNSAPMLRILKSLLTEILYPIISMNGDVFVVVAMQPSGVYGTAELNSIKNLIILMYIFYMLCSDKDFFSEVLPDTYGDDLIAAVKETSIARFNNITIAEYCKTYLDMDFTPSSKEGEHRAYLSTSELSFLKRNFQYSNILCKWVAPLQKTSIAKSLMMYIPSKSISSDLQQLEMLVSMLYELFLHSQTQFEFEEFRNNFISLGESLGYDYTEVSLKLPSYEKLYEALK